GGGGAAARAGVRPAAAVAVRRPRRALVHDGGGAGHGGRGAAAPRGAARVDRDRGGEPGGERPRQAGVPPQAARGGPGAADPDPVEAADLARLPVGPLGVGRRVRDGRRDGGAARGGGAGRGDGGGGGVLPRLHGRPLSGRRAGGHRGRRARRARDAGVLARAP